MEICWPDGGPVCPSLWVVEIKYSGGVDGGHCKGAKGSPWRRGLQFWCLLFWGSVFLWQGSSPDRDKRSRENPRKLWKEIYPKDESIWTKDWYLTHFLVGVGDLSQSVQSFSHVRLLVTPRIATWQASLSITNTQSLFKLMSIESSPGSDVNTNTWEGWRQQDWAEGEVEWWCSCYSNISQSSYGKPLELGWSFSAVLNWSKAAGLMPSLHLQLRSCWIRVALRRGQNFQWLTPLQFSSVTQSCLTFCNPMDCSTPGLCVHHAVHIQANIIENKGLD